MPNEAMSLSRRNIAAMARKSADKAIEVLVTALDNEDVKVRIDAASKLLDRAVGRPPQALIGGEDDDNPIMIEQIRRIIIDKSDNTDSPGLPAPSPAEPV